MNESKIGMILMGALATMTGCVDLAHDDAAEGTRSSEVSATGGEPLRFVGKSGDWFSPKNWDGRRVPGPHDDVVIAGNARVVIDPARNPAGQAPIVIGDLQIEGKASFETLAGTELQFGVLTAHDQASYFAYSSTWHGAAAAGGPTYDCPRWRCGYNPSAIDIGYYDISGGSLAMFIGGTQPARPGATGPGHHASIRGDEISVDGVELLVAFKYGFVPAPGDRFVIVEAREQLSGTFVNAATGDEVARAGDVALVASYEPNRIVLVAVAR